MNVRFPVWNKLLIIQLKVSCNQITWRKLRIITQTVCMFSWQQLCEWAAADYVSPHIYCFWRGWNRFMISLPLYLYRDKHRSKAIKAAWWKTMITTWTKRNKWADWTAAEEPRGGGGGGRHRPVRKRSEKEETAALSWTGSINVYESRSWCCKNF